MIAIHQNKVLDVQANFSPEIEKQRIAALKKLKAIKKSQFNQKEKDYLILVIAAFKKTATNQIITSLPSDINNLIISIGKVPPNSRFNNNGKAKKSLKKFILDALNYKYKRTSFYPRYFREIGIKTCVYCNSQLAISSKKTNNGYSSRFDVDHYHSKDDYPFLSICLFNLYPACAPCNRAKGIKEIEFELYTDVISKTLASEYSFKLAPYSLSKYLTTKDSSEIHFEYKEPIYINPNAKNFRDVFNIEGIYKTQNDLIEELIIKSQMYNNSYLKILKNNFSKLNLNPELFKRTLVGNYVKDKEMHKRPMSKFMQDIAKDLGVID